MCRCVVGHRHRAAARFVSARRQPSPVSGPKHQAARDDGWRILVFSQEDLLDEPIVAGRRMLEFGGYEGRAIPPALARLLDERSGAGTASAVPFVRREAGSP